MLPTQQEPPPPCIQRPLLLDEGKRFNFSVMRALHEAWPDGILAVNDEVPGGVTESKVSRNFGNLRNYIRRLLDGPRKFSRTDRSSRQSSTRSAIHRGSSIGCRNSMPITRPMITASCC